jgi:hypothetical protein
MDQEGGTVVARQRASPEVCKPLPCHQAVHRFTRGGVTKFLLRAASSVGEHERPEF